MTLAQQPAGIDAGHGKSIGHLTPAEAAEGCETVKMELHGPVFLTVEHYNKTISFPCAKKDGVYQPTIHNVPVELADHWWLAENKVKHVAVADTQPAEKAAKKK
jgi:hypothetical protein